MITRQEYLTNVYWDTREKCVEHNWLLKQPKSKLYRGINCDFRPKIMGDVANVSVYDKDTIDVALMMKYQGLNPLVLNMASYQHPGGGAEKGASAQEECLFRRTDYYRHLPKNIYPLRMMDAVYSPDVTVIKRQDYQMMSPNTFITLDFVAVAAIREPELIGGMLNPDAASVMETKIEQIFQIAATTGHDSLVLGAFGCGAYGNPPEQIASMFKTACVKYKRTFINISFAVLSCNTNNYEVFSRVLK